jgi:hypothetical protein
MEQQGQQCWWESEQAHQIAGGWTAEKQRRHDERHKQAGDRESDWKLLVKQLEQDGISFTRSNTTAAAAVQATNDEQGFRGGSEPETAEAVGSSWSNKADIKHEKKERRRRRVEERRGAAAETVGAAGTLGPAAEAVEANAAAPEATEDESVKATQAAADACAADAAESGMVSKAELQTQDDKQKRKKEKDRRRRQARRLKAAGAKAEAVGDQEEE